MKKTLAIISKTLLILLVAGWMTLIIVEYYRFQDHKPMLVAVKKQTLTYPDGKVYVNWGLGYKTITYDRTSISGYEFGHFLKKVKEKLPKKNTEKVVVEH